MINADEDISLAEISVRIDALPYDERARVVVDRLLEACRRGATGTELGDLYVALVSAMFIDLPSEYWWAVHDRLVGELAQNIELPESDIWDAINARTTEDE